jgi:hypothetical protein
MKRKLDAFSYTLCREKSTRRRRAMENYQMHQTSAITTKFKPVQMPNKGYGGRASAR